MPDSCDLGFVGVHTIWTGLIMRGTNGKNISPSTAYVSQFD